MAFDAAPDTVSTEKLILQRARDMLARGWVQGTCQRGSSYCMVGALIEVDGIGEPVCDAVTALGFSSSMDMAAWNDARGRTQAEVLARFDAALAR